MTDFTSYVNIKQGTASELRYSNGNTLPLVAAPFGMNAFCLQTRGAGGGWFYHPSHKQVEGIRVTHQPSPWVRDYGHFVVMPQSGEVFVQEDGSGSGYAELDMNPAYMEIYLKRYRAWVGLAATARAAIMEIRWDTKETKRLAILPFEFETDIELSPDSMELTGYTNATGDGTGKDFKTFFYMKFNRPVDTAQTVITKNSGKQEQRLSGNGMGVGINIAFDIPEGENLTVQLGISYLSANQAKLNAERELGDKSYEEIKEQTKSAWNELLSRITITAPKEQKKTFYSCLYRCFLFPRKFYEYDENGEPVHYSVKSGRIKSGVSYTDNGFWDTCRTLYPLFALLIPDEMSEMMEGYLNFYREEGWLPKWISPGERGIMPGTLIDAVLADAALKGILTREQMEVALEGMLKNANVSSGTHLNGRIGVEDYVEKGYVPADMYGESVNNSLDAYYCDFCISQLAGLLGKTDIREEYEKRAKGYRVLFDKQEGFIRGLNADGSRKKDFSPFSWGGEYCEGGAWQNAFGVYHDIEGLAELYGGRDAFIQKLDELFTSPPFFEVGTYNIEIHEMTEMANADFGQCAISNQPSFHIPYLYSALGRREKTAYWVHRIVEEAFDSTEEGFPGDEDNGSMSAWYIFSVLGFYPICPGKAEYVMGTCNVKEVKVFLGNGRVLTIKNGLQNMTDMESIKVYVDGVKLTSQFLLHEQLMNASEIGFC